MEKTYNPQSFENKIYKTWMDKKYFTPQIDEDKTPFTIVIPPPNITGQLHMGHALNCTIQDAIIRFKRMQGYSALWLPGTDHASIATEVKIVQEMDTENLTKKGIGREAFLKRAFAWKEKYGGKIVEQLKSLGSSCDWSRLAFTMDENCSKAVNHVFVELYKKGLIYQGDRIINWCPDCKTAISDAEVDYLEKDGSFWYIKYKIKNSIDYITVATTRPETMLGDTAVAVNPNDERYKKFIGKTAILPLLNREIKIIADDYVDAKFGTGAVKITPAHDPNDFDVAQRHKLEIVRVMDDNAIINSFGGKYLGQDRFTARKNIVKDLTDLGLLSKIEPHKHNVGHCYRCGTIIEPIVSKQWFVKMESLARPAVDAVKNKSVKFIPKRFEKIYFSWMENIKDWCISRQLWWGHQIPAYHCKDCSDTMVSLEEIKMCRKCKSKNVTRDEDVLDTWFSSALWPFSTLGYPAKTADLQYFYPTDVLVTARDIIFFWVARMIFSGLEYMGKVPFRDVLITALVCDINGKKMSKSLGNGIDPVELIEKYGADTLRFSLLNGTSAGKDIRFSEDKVDICKNFLNKIWNASRFVLLNLEDRKVLDISEIKLNLADKWILKKLNTTIREVTKNMEKYELGLASAKLYDFVWSDFCDWYIEMTKPVLYGTNQNAIISTLSVLTYVLKNILKLLHPFVPFITEEIYQALPNASESIMISNFPSYSKRLSFNKEADNMQKIMEVVKAVRNLRAEMNVPMSKRAKLIFLENENSIVVTDAKLYVEKLAFSSGIEFIKKENLTSGLLPVTTTHFEAYLNLDELVDKEKELKRLNDELEKAADELNRAKGKLSNKG
ncbi:MAG: valine--tRNA ligase, partial [Firmicutes bacterium]|nr:valine--tRNA ligase [Bacillota bacterium]